MKTTMKPKAEYAIQTVANALRMLEVFHTESEMGVSDLARRLKLHKNNAFRLLATLELAGYIRQNPETELYGLGPKCLELGEAYKRHHDLIEQARPMLEELSQTSGETAHLGSLVDDEVIHLVGVEPDQLVLTGSRAGSRLPSHCTALGKVLLAGGLAASIASASVDASAEAPLANQELTAFTGTTIVDRTKLVEELRNVEMQGYAIDVEEFSSGLCCVAAPIRDANSKVVAALSISGPSFRMPENILHGAAATAVVETADQLSKELGAPS